MRYNPDIHKRRSIRLEDYDYSQEGVYFVTVCTYQKAQIFGEIINSEMVLSNIGIVVRDEWFNIGGIHKEIELGEFVVMPNHIHGIIMIKSDELDVGVYAVNPNTSNPMNEKTVCGGLHRTPEVGLRRKPLHDHRRGMKPKSLGSFVNGFKGSVTSRTIKICNSLDFNSNQIVQNQTNVGVCAANPNTANPNTANPNTANPNTVNPNTVNPRHKTGEYQPIWQRNYYEHIIRDEKEFLKITNYIYNNPQNWATDEDNPVNLNVGTRHVSPWEFNIFKGVPK
jgi:putative transposase